MASLYERPGGYDKIAAIVRGQFARMQADPQFARFGTGRSIDSTGVDRVKPATFDR